MKAQNVPDTRGSSPAMTGLKFTLQDRLTAGPDALTVAMQVRILLLDPIMLR
jgi:hypothetical protein